MNIYTKKEKEKKTIYIYNYHREKNKQDNESSNKTQLIYEKQLWYGAHIYKLRKLNLRNYNTNSNIKWKIEKYTRYK